MKPFTNTVAGRKRLLRVCHVVREGLGMGDLSWDYRATEEMGKMWSFCLIPDHGWTVVVYFCPKFFGLEFQHQIETIVHEHLHAAMVPVNQFICKMLRASKDRKRLQEAHKTADEITVEHLTVPVLRMLWPKIKEVL